MITCVPEAKIFFKETTGYTVVSYRTKDEIPEEAVTERGGGYYWFKATGTNLPFADEVTVELDGKWVKNSYGWQMEVEDYQVTLPKTREGIIGYLSSGLIKGVGLATAVKIVDMFGEDTFTVMETEPERLLAVKGISREKLYEIRTSYAESSQVRELMSYLAPYKVTPKKVQMIQNAFGDNALAILKENPYRLCEISGLGFLTVDPIASRIHHFTKDSPYRLAAGIQHVLQTGMTEGHLYLPASEVIVRAENLFRDLHTPMDADVLKAAGNRMVLKDKTLSCDKGVIYLPKNLLDEKTAASQLARIMHAGCERIEVDDKLETAQKLDGITLGEKQKEAVRKAFLYPVSIITGGPGRGKTTVLKTILRIYKAVVGGDVLCCAPTGRAARRMRESTGYPAITIHKALCLTEDETFGTPNEEMMQEEMVIVDETTMVDMNLARVLFSKVLDGTRLVLVGDADQLPSVGPGNVFTELIASGVIPTTYLDISYRQKDGSGIIGNAEKINSGNTKLKFGKDFQFIRANTAQEAAEEIKSLVKRLVDNGKSVDDIQILSPVKKQEDVGVYALNTAMQEMFNPPAADKAELVVGKETFRVGDKVMQMVNLEEVSNGDIGTVMKIWRCEGKDAMSVLFSEERMEIYTDENLDQLVHAYALTVHKSQGGEYPIVIMPVLQVFRRMLKRNVLYTGVTRASETVYLVGTTSALVMAIHANDAKRRNTMLASRVQEEAERINAGNKAA